MNKLIKTHLPYINLARTKPPKTAFLIFFNFSLKIKKTFSPEKLEMMILRTITKFKAILSMKYPTKTN